LMRPHLDQMLRVGVRCPSALRQWALLLPVTGDIVRYGAPDDPEGR
jgi:hypothetical protein